MNPLEAMIVLTFLIVALVVWGISFSSRDPTTPNPVSGQALSIETIIPADVLARVELLRAELEVIRFEMGQPKEQRPGITVTDVASREVIFQTFTLFRKANQLSFELTGHMRPELPITLPQNIRPLHVWRIVDAAYKCIILGKRSLGLTNHIEETRQGELVTSSDVFHAIGQANRQIDMLFRPRSRLAIRFSKSYWPRNIQPGCWRSFREPHRCLALLPLNMVSNLLLSTIFLPNVILESRALLNALDLKLCHLKSLDSRQMAMTSLR